MNDDRDVTGQQSSIGDQKFALFPIDLNLPDAPDHLVENASAAIRREYRDSVKWKQLQCSNVEPVSATDMCSVFALKISHAIEFDWTWEGAVAFKPLGMSQEAIGVGQLNADDAAAYEDSSLWSGEILEVDETGSRLFVRVSDRDHPPTIGAFFVKPFEFLAALDAIYGDPRFVIAQSLLPSRLLATKGGVHPPVVDQQKVGLTDLWEWWGRSWSVLWGPPGTGKTYTTGQQIARILSDPSERVLVVSTTNRATDAVAISIGEDAKSHAPQELQSGRMLRIGKGAAIQRFEEANLTAMLQGTETALLQELDQHSKDLARASDPELRALIRSEMHEIRNRMRDAARTILLDRECRVVVSTAFRATTFAKSEEVREALESGHALFTTVVIDEAGLISRAAAAVLSLLASRRVVLVGDSKQLAPISRISRVLPTDQMTWLANSGVSHLTSFGSNPIGVHVLREQHRMHPDICQVVSSYQYGGALTTADRVLQRESAVPLNLHSQPRAIWYVLDEDAEEIHMVRAERGPGNRSWVRLATRKVLERLFSDATFRSSNGLFVSPFKAQVKDIAAMIARERLETWTSSTVHSQQGAEADVVIFDTVNAGSCCWPPDEWKRLVNVALSRAKHAVILLASRAEMTEPFLDELLKHLPPKVLRARGGHFKWEDVSPTTPYIRPGATTPSPDPNTLGMQLLQRKALLPILSKEQEQLCQLDLDGKPRLVRGVAGSGKTIVLANWLMQTAKRLENRPDAPIWAVFANRSLETLIRSSIDAAWKQESDGVGFPWERVKLIHIRDLLMSLLLGVRRSIEEFGFEYDDAAAAYLECVSSDRIDSHCEALFIDEAQDMGPNTLKLLTSLARQTDSTDANSRAVHVFYDNAQNIYGRGTPTWSEIGLGMRGRSTVMKESFRSTTPIIEFALNVLYRLQPPTNNPDHRELVGRRLIEKVERNGKAWWKVRFNQVDGPKPEHHVYPTKEAEFDAIAEYCRKLIEDDHVKPSDICIICNHTAMMYDLETRVTSSVRRLSVEVSVQNSQQYYRHDWLLLITTPHSFKGYDSEVVIVAGADKFVLREEKRILESTLYVAMTRARSVLTLYSQESNSIEGRKIRTVIEDCLNDLCERPEVENAIDRRDEFDRMVASIGETHRDWLDKLWSDAQLEPLLAEDGELLAEPMFWFRRGSRTYACFSSALPQRKARLLEDAGITAFGVGDMLAGM